MDPEQLGDRSGARAVLGGGHHGRPFEGTGRTRRIAPFVGVALIAFVAVLLVAPGDRHVEVLIAALLIPPLLGTAYTMPWARLPSWVQAAPPLIYFAVVALMRDASGADTSIFTVLVLLPVFWFALYGTRPQLVASLVGLYLTLAMPAVIAAGPHYPPRNELVRAFLWLVAAGALALAVHRLVVAVRNLATEYGSIVHSAHDSFISIDADGLIVEWNRQAERDFGWRRDEVIGRRIDEVVVPPADRVSGGRIRGLLRSDGSWGSGRRAEIQAVHRDGHEFPVEMTVSSMMLEDGHRLNLFLHDISDRRKGERALREAQERFRRAFDDAAIGMAITSPEGRWLQVNQSLADLSGYPKDQLVGMASADITHPDDLGADIEALRDLVAGRRHRFVTEKRYFHADGRLVWISLSVSAVRGDQGEVLYLISQMQDITERKQAEAKLAHQAMHDPLTALPNRTLFNDRLRLARARILRGGSLALLFCDLDYFKEVNDSLGHDAGDRLLVEVAGRLRSVLRPSDTIARLGGDEFAILCEGIDMEAAEMIACRVAEAFAPPFLIDGREVLLNASTGIVLTRRPNFDSERLVQDADIAMYAAKQGGRARHVFFRPELRDLRTPHLHLSERASPEDVEPDPLSI